MSDSAEGISGDFNPHPHAEGDPKILPHCTLQWDFNPHPHAEGDLIKITGDTAYSYFNPHPHAEGDATTAIMSRERSRFQSTPSRRG